MKRLVLATTLLTAALLQGCIISSDDDDDGGGGGGDGAAVTVLVTCPTGATTFTVSGLGGDETDDCGSAADLVILVDPGTYAVTVTANDGDVAYPGVVESVTVADGDEYTLKVVLSAAQMELTWTIDDFEPDQTACDDLGAGGVSALATVAGTAEAYEDIYDCAAGGGISSPMYLDDYVVVVALLDTDDLSIADSSEIEVSLVDDGQIEDLGNINFVTEL